VSPQKKTLDSTESGRMFYIAGLGYLLFGVIVGTGIWRTWPAMLRMGTPKEIHIHANNWGFMALVFAGLTVDYYGRFTGHRLTGGKRAIDVVFWLMSIGTLGLIFGPWMDGNLFIIVPGMLMHLTGTVLLLWMMIKPLIGDRPACTPGVWHLILSYVWLLMPVITSPIILLGVPGFDGAMAEANAPQALVYGWILQGAAAMTGYFTMRVFVPQRPAKLGSTWWTLLGFNAGGILLWMGIVKPELFVPLQGGAYAVWAITTLTYAVSLLLIMKEGTDIEEGTATI
jgi:cytochrome c oxidase cbb3-type subunit 1